jgi:hypothetical protein
MMKRSPVKSSGRVVGFDEYQEDPGEPDKRLLVFQPEFANTLPVCMREGNTLSAIIREAWDRRRLENISQELTRARNRCSHFYPSAHHQ